MPKAHGIRVNIRPLSYLNYRRRRGLIRKHPKTSWQMFHYVCLSASIFMLGFIVKRGKVSPLIKGLIKDMRRVMYPYTASSLKEEKHQKMHDYVKTAELYHATHLLSFSMTENNTFFKVCKLPAGPTATFKVLNYTLAGDLVTNHSLSKVSTNSPLLVMSGFGKEESNVSEASKIVSVLLQSIFPPINVHAINLSQCKRVVLFNSMKAEEGSDAVKVEFRHYEITTRQRNVNKAVSLSNNP